MRTVNVQELKDRSSGYLADAKNGEELVVSDGDVPVARILPFRRETQRQREEQLVASGALKMPLQKIDWDEFFQIPAANVARETAVEAAVESRGDR